MQIYRVGFRGGTDKLTEVFEGPCLPVCSKVPVGPPHQPKPPRDFSPIAPPFGQAIPHSTAVVQRPTNDECECAHKQSKVCIFLSQTLW